MEIRILEGDFMFDTVVCSLGVLPCSIAKFEDEIIKGLSCNYTIARKLIPFYSATLNKHAYQLLIKLVNKENPKKYFLLKLCPRKDLLGIPELKLKTEISHFSGFGKFQEELAAANSSEVWSYLIDQSTLSVLHAKCDHKKVFLDDLRIYLNADSPRAPFLATNPKTGRRTLYVSPNHYYYEKEGFVRAEIRLKGSHRIFSKMGVTKLSQLGVVEGVRYNKLFSVVSFKNPLRLIRKLNKKEREAYSYYLKSLNNPDFEHIVTRRRKYLKSKNCLLSSKETVSAYAGKKVASSVFLAMGSTKIDLASGLNLEVSVFKRTR
jgi:hypothetical protein